jgi:hypothetical protein
MDPSGGAAAAAAAAAPIPKRKRGRPRTLTEGPFCATTCMRVPFGVLLPVLAEFSLLYLCVLRFVQSNVPPLR